MTRPMTAMAAIAIPRYTVVMWLGDDTAALTADGVCVAVVDDVMASKGDVALGEKTSGEDEDGNNEDDMLVTNAELEVSDAIDELKLRLELEIDVIDENAGVEDDKLRVGWEVVVVDHHDVEEGVSIRVEAMLDVDRGIDGGIKDERAVISVAEARVDA